MKSTKTTSVFTELKDAAKIDRVKTITKAPMCVNKVLFWRNEAENVIGLTMKPASNLMPDSKISVYGKVGEDILRPSKGSTDHVGCITGDEYFEIINIYKSISI